MNISVLADPYWPIWFVLLALATWRVTSIIQLESIMAPLRSAVGIVDHEDPEKRVYPDRFIGRLLSCFWCTSVWVGIAMFDLWLLGVQVVAIPFALSMVAIVIQEVRYHSEKTRQRWCYEDDEHSRKTLANWLIALPVSELERFTDLLGRLDVTHKEAQEYIWHHPYSHLLPEMVRDRLIEPGWYTVIKLLIADELRHRKTGEARIVIHTDKGEWLQDMRQARCSSI